MTTGMYEADLGGGLLKKRIARPGQGKVAAFARWSLPIRETTGFSCTTSRRTSAATATKMIEDALKKLAVHLLSLTVQALSKTQRAGELMEVECAMRKNKSAILEAVQDTARGLHKAGVMDQFTLREFDRLCLPPVQSLEPAQIKLICEATWVSQAVFAVLLNTSLSTVLKWQIGQNYPRASPLSCFTWCKSTAWKSSPETWLWGRAAIGAFGAPPPRSATALTLT